MTLDLAELTKLRELFKRFSSGVHLNHLQDNELWVELETHQNEYTSIFTALGFVLVLDGRGFAYFKTEQGTTYTGKLTRRLALTLMLLFEYQADQGAHLFQFQHWHIDAELIETLWQQYQSVLEAEEFSGSHAIKELFDSAARVGFVSVEDNVYRLLPAVHRYLDLFEELALAERPDQERVDDNDEEEGAS